MPKYVHIAGFAILLCVLMYVLLHVLAPASNSTPQGNANHPPSHHVSSHMLYGLTIDDSWEGTRKLADIVEALQRLPARPTVRIVMSKDRSPQRYRGLFKAIHRVADIMAQPVDSSDMHSYSTEHYQQRFAESYQYLSHYVAIWEVGNEMNGQEWIKEDPRLTAAKVASAYRYIKDKRAAAALVPYQAKAR